MNRLALAAASLGFASVAFGAFGAHALGSALTETTRGWWDTATGYALPHAAAALAIAIAGKSGWTRAGGWCLVIGAAVFAASLYAMALGAPRALGAITPIGGVLMLAGWMLAAASAARRSA